MLKIIIVVISFFIISKFNPLKNNSWIKVQAEKKTEGKKDEEIKQLISKITTWEFLPIVLWLIFIFTIQNTSLFALISLIIIVAYFPLGALITNLQRKRDPLVVEQEIESIRRKQSEKDMIAKNRAEEASKKSQKKKGTYATPVQTQEISTDKKAGLFSSSTYCPHCRSLNVSFMQNNKKGFSVGKAVGGAALTGGIGTLAGFAGKKGKNQWHCQNCGKTFETKK